MHILAGYEAGIFPMGEGSETYWYDADPRAIIPLDNEIKIQRSLRQAINKSEYRITHNVCFEEVIAGCARRENTWINDDIRNAFTELYKMGFGHSIEAWHNGTLCGGLYGVAYNGAFFGESMFHEKSNSSKICVIRLINSLKKCRFVLLDIQMMTPHFRKLGAVEICKTEYLELLSNAMSLKREFKFF